MKKRLAIGAVIVLLIACCGLYLSGNVGISEGKIFQEQMESVSWEKQDYTAIGTSDGESLYVGVMRMNDFSDAKYFIYVKRGGLSLGWHFLQSGSLTEAEGLVALDCGAYGTAYVALNRNYDIQRIEFEDGRAPVEDVGATICECSKSAVLFYDAFGDLVASTRVAV